MTTFRLLMTLSVLEILALVIVLAIFLVLITNKLRSIADTLAEVAFGVRAVEVQVRNVGPSVQRINSVLREMGNALPSVAGKAEELAAGRR